MFFFFCKQKTAYEVRISDWSSDVCSSDLSLTVEPAKGGAAETIEADAVLVAIGLKPNTDGLALDKAGLATNARGQIETDHDFATTVSGTWAIGKSEEHTLTYRH